MAAARPTRFFLTAAAFVTAFAAALDGGLAAVKPAAIYTAAQAAAGSKAYAASCASCHGEQLEGGVGPALSGQNLVTLSKNTHLTVSDVWEFASLQMPLNAPASLPKTQYAAIIAFILKFNGYPAGAKPLTPASADASKMTFTSLKRP
jgi:mono/diheme cytochrome c family protein